MLDSAHFGRTLQRHEPVDDTDAGAYLQICGVVTQGQFNQWVRLYRSGKTASRRRMAVDRRVVREMVIAVVASKGASALQLGRAMCAFIQHRGLPAKHAGRTLAWPAGTSFPPITPPSHRRRPHRRRHPLRHRPRLSPCHQRETTFNGSNYELQPEDRARWRRLPLLRGWPLADRGYLGPADRLCGRTEEG